MKTSEIANILREVSEADLEQMPPSAMLSWLARRICELTHCTRVILYGALIQPGQTQPSPTASVLFGASDPNWPHPPAQVGDLQLFGKPAVLGDMRRVTCWLTSGPQQDPDLSLARGENCLQVRVRVPTAVCWALVFGGEALRDQEAISAWTDGVSATLEAVLRAVNANDEGTARGRRARFYRALLEEIPADRMARFKQLCRAWLSTMKANWVWLLLYNPYAQDFEIGQFASTDALEGQPGRVLPERWIRAGNRCAATYCTSKREPMYTEDIPGWRGRHEGQEYSIVTAAFQVERGAKAVECVPVLSTIREGLDVRTEICGAVLLSYRDPQARVVQPRDALLGMGRFSALCIRNALAQEQKGLLVKLNEMAYRHLTRPSREPESVRQQYLEELIGLIRQWLQVGGVSVFYRARFGSAVQCLASTGLRRKEGAQIPKASLPEACYKAGEGLTGRCFADCELILGSQIAELSGHVGKFEEIRSTLGSDDFDPIILCPIPAHAGRGEVRSALGVVRCVENHAPADPQKLSNFDPTDVETLQFIAQQIGPILQTFEQRIDRETTVSVVRHDLCSPISMIRDTVAEMSLRAAKNEPFGPHDLSDIQACCSLVVILAKQLEHDSGVLPLGTVAPVDLEGEIVARLKNVIWPYAHGSRRMTLHFDGFRGIPRLALDRDLVERAFFNVILNAIKYGTRGTEVRIEGMPTSSDRFHYVVEIRNQGIGLERQEQEYLFNRGYQSPRARRYAGQGAGQGLFIAREAMRKHDGDVRLIRPKDPTIFALLFPKDLEVQR